MNFRSKGLRWTVIVFLTALFAFVAGGITSLLLVKPTTLTTAFFAPNQKRFVVVTEDDAGPRKTILVVKIYDRVSNGFYERDELVYAVDSRASARMKWSGMWINDSLFMLNTSDIGAVGWKLGEDGNWQQLSDSEAAQYYNH